MYYILQMPIECNHRHVGTLCQVSARSPHTVPQLVDRKSYRCSAKRSLCPHAAGEPSGPVSRNLPWRQSTPLCTNRDTPPGSEPHGPPHPDQREPYLITAIIQNLPPVTSTD